jgi:hypothetical protein
VTTAQDVRNFALRDSGRDFNIMGRPSESTITPSAQERLTNFRAFMADSDIRVKEFQDSTMANAINEGRKSMAPARVISGALSGTNFTEPVEPLQPPPPFYPNRSFTPSGSNWTDTVARQNFSPYEQNAMRTPNFKPRR